jgi:ATP-binding cassette, subfamily B, bacterial
MAGADPGPQTPQRRNEIRRLLPLIRSALRLVFDAAPRLVVITTVLQLLGGLVLAAQVFLVRRLLLDLLNAPSGSTSRLDHAYPIIAGLTAAVAVSALSNLVRFEVQPLLGERVTRHSLQRVVRIASTVELSRLEDADYHDRLQRALINSGIRSLQMTAGLTSMVGSLLSAGAIGIALLIIQPLLFAAALLAGIPLFLTTMRASRAIYRFTFDQTPTDRRRIYLQTLMTQQGPAKDIRSYNLVDYLHTTYAELYDARITAFQDVVLARVRRGALSSVLTAVISGGALALLVLLVDHHHLSLASAGAAGAALVLLGGQLQSVVSGVGALYESSLFMGDYFAFIAEADAQKALAAGDVPAPRTFRKLAVDSVTFTYPNGDRPALTDVSMVLPMGHVIALVGDNGSGKTTLAKLVAGLYQPQAGHITWDGADAAAFSPVTLRDAVAVLFQDFSRFATSARDNIGWGRWEAMDDDERVLFAASQSDALGFLEELPAGMSTQIGPEFLGGIDLSGGQWQRVALARALFRDTPLVILDEPTAALDPRAEAALFADVRRVFQGKTVLMVSHRMATVKTADYIYVLDKGSVLEQGSHEELLAKQGRYAEMFNFQRDAYR